MKYNYATKRTTREILTITLLCSISLFSGCIHKQERTTTIYGTITDQNKQPVDSILVVVAGLVGTSEEILKKVYTDKLGKYELVAEVPKEFNSVDVGVPFFPLENPKFMDNYKDKIIYKDDELTNNCCTAMVGEKTRYDFQLISVL